jgi:hypothetical protein
MKTPFRYLAILILAGLMAGCGDQEENFTDSYLAALEKHPGAPAREEWVRHFVATYGDFGSPSLGQRIRDIYAPEFHFNDTLRTIRERRQLALYLEHTAERLESMELQVLDQQFTGRDVYLRWTMRTRFTAAWRDVDVTTPGMTHLRFNDAGEVILHQDFWDSRQGIFEHIPVIGGLINLVKGGL